MRKLFFIITIGGLITAIGCSDCPGPETTGRASTANPQGSIAGGNNDLASLLDESTINLEFHVKELIDAQKEINLCDTYLKIGTTAVNGINTKEEIKGADFLKLYEIAEGMNDEACYLTGLKIIFGIDATNNICLLYQPVRLFNEEQIGAGSKVCSYETIEDDCYQYDQGAGFKKIDDSDKNPLVDKYKTDILIKHNESGTFSEFLPGVDVESMVFSFQEIFALMYDNKKVETNDDIFDENNVDPVLIYSCIRENSINPSFSPKHSLLLSTVSADKMGLFEGKFANLAHLCPPNCADNLFVFRLENIRSSCH